MLNRVALLLLLSAPSAAARADDFATRYFDEGRGVFSFAKVVDRVLPSVVQITIIATSDPAKAKTARGAHNDDQKGERTIGTGSGVIIDAQKGYVLTNNHVVTADDNLPAGTRLRFKVGLRDGREFPGDVVGRDELTDVALLRIPAEDLAAIDIIDSGSLEVGDLVLAIGYPLGLDQTVTMGVVSGLRRHLSDKSLQDFIQTDAAVNHGNSGGPLIDSRGRLVGLNSSIANPYGEGNIGLNFAVPTRIAMEVTAQLARYGTVHRGRIGIAAEDLTPPLAKAIGAPVPRGALIREVEPDMPAAQAGLRADDIVIRAGESEILSAADLRNIIGLTETGESIALSFYRDGREQSLTITIPAAAGVATAAPPQKPGKTERKTDEVSLFGATFAEMPPDHPLRGKAEGVVVIVVSAGSPAEAQGLKPGDLVESVNKKPTRDLAAFQEAVGGAAEAVAMRVVRGGTVRIAVFARTKNG
ncbi:MAG: trypsin-like peptidase domain-containing protein [Alphaproteobacteria bacterium]|nr:trypsin-like peptidase domain-containing protein [Alphaproteobacteria bacterium]